MSVLIFESPRYDNLRNYALSDNKIVFEAVLQTLDEPNKNGRVYPKEVVAEALQSVESFIKQRIFGGELDHPLPTEDEVHTQLRHITPSLKEMSHIFTKIWIEGNKLVGRGETLSTPNGNILKSLIQDGVRIGFSIRALAENISRKGDYDYVERPLQLIAVDAVAVPSHEKAKITKILHLESLLKNVKDNYSKVLLESYMERLNKKYSISSFYRIEKIYEF